MSEADRSGGEKEFVTVAQAAQRLGISERQVRRDVRTLPDNDRRVSGKGPAYVRLSALSALRSGPAREERTGQATPDNDRHMSGHDRQAPDSAGHEGGALLEQLRADLLQARADLEHERAEHRADVERWSRAHDQGQQLHLAAVADLQELRRRAAELEAQNAKLIAALPTEPAENTPMGLTGDTESDDSVRGGVDAPPEAPEVKKRRWFWQR